MAKTPSIRWLTEPEAQNYPNAYQYLLLTHSPLQAASIVAALKTAPVIEFKAKDIFRASQLSLLGVSNTHIQRDKRKIKNGQALSPILIVRNINLNKITIADGYHRLCAVYAYCEDCNIPCKIVS